MVADFSRVLAGPLAAMMLADLGAIVIKVERPRVGDDTHQWGPPWTDNSSSYFEAANRNKKSVELDLADPEDRQLPTPLIWPSASASSPLSRWVRRRHPRPATPPR